MSNDKPEVGQKFVHERDGDVTVQAVKLHGRRSKDGTPSGLVSYVDMDGVARTCGIKEFRKAVQS